MTSNNAVPIFEDFPANWELTTLGDVCNRGGGYIHTGPFGSQLHASDYVQDGVPTIMPVNIGNNQILVDGIARITEKDAERLSRHRLATGDIVFSRRGDVTRRALVRDEQKGWLCGTGCLKINFGEGIVDPLFASLYFGHPDVKDWIVRHAVGSTMPNLNGKIMDAIPFLLPPLSEQQVITRILGALDDKIELHRHINHTLEEMSRALFKSWFVDFDPVTAKAEGRVPFGMNAETASLFPAEFEETGEGSIPKGWKVGTIGDIANVIDCLHAKKPERQESGKIFLQLNNIRDDSLIDLNDIFYISDDDYTKWISRLETKEGDCVITNVGRVGAVAQIPAGLSAALGRNMTAIRCKEDFPFPAYLVTCLTSDVMREEINTKIDTGTILDALNVKNIPLLKFVLAPKPVLSAFEKIVRPLRMKMEINLNNSRTLATIRDALLPKLLSGDLRVKERP